MNDPRLTTMHVFGVPGRNVGRALSRMALDRRQLKATSGLRFWKLLATGDSRTYTLRDANPRRWALLSVWESDDDLDRFERWSPVMRGWARITEERWRAELWPLRSRGSWAGVEPFGALSPAAQGPDTVSHVAAITRARLRPRAMRRFWRSVGPVASDARQAPGLLLAVGIGDAPVGLQATFSVWQDQTALEAFAYRGSHHREAVRRTAEERWYSEELFARFEVRDAEGTVDGSDPLAA